MRSVVALLLFLAVQVVPASAQTELSFYGGLQTAPNSRVSGGDPGGAGTFDFLAVWEARPFSAPPYFGLRLTWWGKDGWGWGLDFSRDKVSADPVSLAANGLTALEFGDGLNIVTVNRYRQWSDFRGSIVPYIGAGLGISVPFVEFDSGAGITSEYQLGGPAVAVVAGARYPLGDRWSVFGEYKGTYSVNTIDLVSGGDLNANIITNSFNIGASFGF